jgi:hypothetical protein
MHKIKEMLHKDSEDKDIKRDDDLKLHAHNDSDLKHSHGNKGEILKEENFQHGHTKHGEIEHGKTTSTTTREIVHEHGHSHSHSHDKHLHSGEKHTYYEREHLEGGNNLYREGVDPTLNREIVTETRHDGGVSRSVVDEGKIIKEKIKEVELHKVQPVIHRDREQKEIRHVVEPHQQFEVKDTHIAHREKDIDLGVRREASSLETSRSIGSAPQMESSREILATERQHQELPTKLEEHVHRKVEEHIHPVIYKETLKPKVTEEVHHLYETVKEKPIETYEVKDVRVHGDGSLNNAERAFFQEHTSRGINIDNSRALDHTHLKEHKHKHEHKHLKEHKHEHTHVQGDNLILNRGDNTNVGMTGHHQNIGAHHLPASAVEGGHNSAYDAALCNQCSGHQICSHSEKDAALMKKMNEKKIVQDDKLQDKEAKRLSKNKTSKKHSEVV